MEQINPYDTKAKQSNSLFVNSSLSNQNQEKTLEKSITLDVLQKISDIIASLHQHLVPKTGNTEIFRQMTQQQQKILKEVQGSNLLHTILAGVLAIDSCLQYINRQENYIVSNLMKSITICLGNYRKMQKQINDLHAQNCSESFLKFFDTFKLIISNIHKIPATKIKNNQIDKHNEFLNQSHMNSFMENALKRQQSIFFSVLTQQNHSLRFRVNQLQKYILTMEKQNDRFYKLSRNLQFCDKKKRDSQNYLTQTSTSLKGCEDQSHSKQIKQLKCQLIQKNDIILKMNDQFSFQITKYQKIFNRLQTQNKILKKYNDLDTALILQQLEYQVEQLRNQKRNDKQIINQIMSKIDRMSVNKNQFAQRVLYDYSNQYYSNNQRVNPMKLRQLRSLSGNRLKAFSRSLSNRQSTIVNQFYSPKIENNQRAVQIDRNIYLKNTMNLGQKRSQSPCFGNVKDQERYNQIREKIIKKRDQQRKKLLNELPITSKTSKYHILQSRNSRNIAQDRKVSDFTQNNRLEKQARIYKLLKTEANCT